MTDLHPYVENEADGRDQRTAFFLPLLAAAVILLLIGVIKVVAGGGEEVEDPLTLLGAAPAALQEAGSARMDMSFGFDGGGMEVTMDGEGVVDFTTGAATFAMDMLGQSIEMRTDGETVWMKMPPMAMPPGASGSWIALPLEEIPGASMNQQMPGLGSTSYFDALLGVNADVEEVGEEEVNGFDTRHFRFTVDITEAIERVPADDRAEMEAAFESMGSDLTAIPMEAWLNDDGVPVRQVLTFDMTQDGMTGTVRMQLDLSDFGVEVDVEPPPADEVVDVSEIPGLAEAMTGEAA